MQVAAQHPQIFLVAFAAHHDQGVPPGHFDPAQGRHIGGVQQQVLVGIQVLQSVAGELFQLRAEISPRLRGRLSQPRLIPACQGVDALAVLHQRPVRADPQRSSVMDPAKVPRRGHLIERHMGAGKHRRAAIGVFAADKRLGIDYGGHPGLRQRMRRQGI